MGGVLPRTQRRDGGWKCHLGLCEAAAVFKLDAEAALVSTFRPKDRKLVEVSAELLFPLAVKDYLAWLHPAGGRAFLVFAVPQGVPTGVVFDSSGGASALSMCTWCHCASAGVVGLLTATLNGRKRVGINVCTDLGCRERLEQQANLSGASVRPAMEKLVSRMGRFASEALRIDLSGVGR